MSENKVVSACIQWLFHNGCFVWRNNSGAYKTTSGAYVRYGAKGSPDIIGTTPSGRFIGVECKYGKNDLEPSQEAFGERLKKKGALYIVAYGVDDLEACKKEILQTEPDSAM